MRAELGPVFYKVGFWGMIVLIPACVLWLKADPELEGRAVKLVFSLPLVPFWLYMKGRKWRDEGWWS